LTANTSPKVFRKRASFQPAYTRCSSIPICSRFGQTRRTVARRTQGTASKLARTACRSTVKKLPSMRRTPEARSSESFTWASAWPRAGSTAIARSVNMGRCATHQTADTTTASATKVSSVLAIVLSSRTLCHGFTRRASPS
jgi:hypothetical protein